MREKERKRERKRKKRENEREKKEKREKMREKDVQGQLLLSICIYFSNVKTKYIGRNAQNLKKWVVDL